MIYVRIELWPGGNRAAAKVLAEAQIANISKLAPISSYTYRLFGKTNSFMGNGEIHGFPRNRFMAWDLLYRVLKHARADKNEPQMQRYAENPHTSE